MLKKAAFFAAIAAGVLFLLLVLLSSTGKEERLFFAYGSNLDAKVIRARIGGLASAVPAKLHSYRLVFEAPNGREFGLPNIKESNNSSVAGALYVLSKEQAERLDKAAGVPHIYRKARVRVFAQGIGEVDAETYVLAGEPSPAPPLKSVFASAIEGLRQFGYGKREEEELASALWEAERMRGR
ncbi:MAG: gamma-glutamylcyclotransferase [Candidatus Micrarchaeota archaeon]|nr:gamma-glutamylcyclotransferase [Candidatus Micrarchaeota archaeon]